MCLKSSLIRNKIFYVLVMKEGWRSLNKIVYLSLNKRMEINLEYLNQDYNNQYFIFHFCGLIFYSTVEQEALPKIIKLEIIF